MSTEADFTPSGPASESEAGPHETSFPLCTDINIVFSGYEDRLVLRGRRMNRPPVTVLLSRRMTLILLAQLLAKLPELSGLDKTPAQYWQEVLQMAHQNALESGRHATPATQAAGSQATAAEPAPGPVEAKPAAGQGKPEGLIYLATALTMQLREGQLVMALSGLPMPGAMTQACKREPLFAMPLQPEHAHQLIQLLIDKAREADWHLPVNLPWLESPPDVATATLGVLH